MPGGSKDPNAAGAVLDHGKDLDLGAVEQIESSLRLLSSECQGFLEVGFDGEGVAALVPGRIVVPGSGSGLSEEPAFGV